jgi:ABC-type multidrug transport system ATPase subunit
MDIEVKNLSKKYLINKNKSLDNVNLSIPKGVFGLIGENGAGKTTLLKSLATLLPISEGSVTIFNYNLPKEGNEVRSILGYLPQKLDLFDNLTVFEMLDYIALLKNILDKDERKRQIIALLNQFNLDNKINSKIKHLSGGMKQRLGIAQCLLGNPKLIILDEPTVGLDPNERLRFRNIINEIAQDKIVIISTHIISDISMMCENVAIMNKGHVIYCGSSYDLTEKVKDKVYVDEIDSSSTVNNSLYEKIISITRKKSKLEVRFISEEIEARDKYHLTEPTLEDAYFYMTFSMEE